MIKEKITALVKKEAKPNKKKNRKSSICTHIINSNNINNK